MLTLRASKLIEPDPYKQQHTNIPHRVYYVLLNILDYSIKDLDLGKTDI